MGLEIALNVFKDVFINTSFAGSFWIYQLLFLFGTLILITRNYKDWGALALPVIVGWHYTIMGFFDVRFFNQIFFLVAGVIFVLDALSLKTIEAGLMSLQEGITKRFTGEARLEARKQSIGVRRMNVEEEMRKISKKYDKNTFTQRLEENDLKEKMREKADRENFFNKYIKGDKRIPDERMAMLNKIGGGNIRPQPSKDDIRNMELNAIANNKRLTWKQVKEMQSRQENYTMKGMGGDPRGFAYSERLKAFNRKKEELKREREKHPNYAPARNLRQLRDENLNRRADAIFKIRDSHRQNEWRGTFKRKQRQTSPKDRYRIGRKLSRQRYEE